MPNSQTYFVKLYKKDGKILGHAVSDNIDFLGIDSDRKSVSTNSDPVVEKLERSIEDFHQSMLVYLDFMPILLDLAHILTSQASLNAVESFLEREGRDKQAFGDGDVYVLTIEAVGRLEKLHSAMVPSFSVQNTLAKNVLVGVVASLDALIGNLINAICHGIPGAAINGEESVLAKDVFRFETLTEFKDFLIAREVDAQSQAGLDSQIKWIAKRLKLDDIASNYGNWSRLGETFQRRHVFVHANGFASAKYIQSAERYGYDKKAVAVGDALSVAPDYVNGAMQVVFEFGVMLSHIVRSKLPDFDGDAAAGELNQLCFSLLQRGDYQLAKDLLEFASKLRGDIKGKTKDMIILNLANACKLLGDTKSCEALISQRDWSNVGFDFSVCKDAVLGDVAKVADAMSKLSFKDYFAEAHCQEWPVFFHVRDDERFKKAFETVFEQKFVPRSRQMTSMAEIIGGIGGSKMIFKLGTDATMQDEQMKV